MFAEIICSGDEILSGRILNTNSQWLSIKLADLGIRVLYHTTVGDDLQPMVSLFRQAIDRSDVVITTGGLGPSVNDLTREALANATGRQLVEYPEALEHVRRFFASRQRPMPERNRVQAVFPVGSLMIPNPNGTAPGIFLTIPRAGRSPCHFICLPGVPVEVHEMWPWVENKLRELGAGQEYILRRDIKSFGAGESQVGSMLVDLIRRGQDPLVGINASQNTIILRITTRGATREECLAKVEPIARTIYDVLGDLIYGEDDQELQDVVVAQLRERRLTLALAESTTAGMVSEWLQRAQGAQGSPYRGGLVLTDPAVVPQVLGRCSGETEPLQGASPENRTVSAQELAQAIRRLFQAHIGIAATPLKLLNEEGTSAEFEVAISTPEETFTKPIRFSSHPQYRQVTEGKHILNTLRLWLKGRA